MFYYFFHFLTFTFPREILHFLVDDKRNWSLFRIFGGFRDYRFSRNYYSIYDCHERWPKKYKQDNFERKKSIKCHLLWFRNFFWMILDLFLNHLCYINYVLVFYHFWIIFELFLNYFWGLFELSLHYFWISLELVLNYFEPFLNYIWIIFELFFF